MNRYIDKAIDLRKKLHEIPEKSMEEIRTKALLMEYITASTDLFISDQGNWFYVSWKPVAHQSAIVFRADYDAVTGADHVSRHLCGHDGHAAILAAFALLINEMRPDQNIILLFQPGEESGQGACICRELFELEDVSEIYAIHNIPAYPLGNVLIKYGTFACASTGLEIEYKGKTAHAAYPETGINPAEAISRLVIDLDDYIKKSHDGIVLSTVIGMDVGSTSYGVSASAGKLRLTVRAEHNKEFEKLLAFLREKVEEYALLYGLTGSMTQIERFPSTENNDTRLEALEKKLHRAGMKYEILEEPFRWSEDFGWYLMEKPGALLGIGAGRNCPQLHTEAYEFPDAVIEYGLKLFQLIVS